MIKLGRILIRDESSIIEARNKIRLLAEDPKFNSMQVTRLAAITSELCRMGSSKRQRGEYGGGF